jgi:hypothetical protein
MGLGGSDESGRRIGGHSMLCPYGNDLSGADSLGHVGGSQRSRRDAGATKDGPPPLVETGQRHGGHSMLCPYGNDLGGEDRLGRAFEESKEPALRKCAQDESLWDSRDGPGATKDGPPPLVEAGLRHSGHSPATTCGTQRARMLPRPYGNDLGRADKVGACVRGVKRAGETPALRKTGLR